MISLRKYKIVTICLIALAVVIMPLGFCVSYAKWTGGVTEINANIDIGAWLMRTDGSVLDEINQDKDGKYDGYGIYTSDDNIEVKGYSEHKGGFQNDFYGFELKLKPGSVFKIYARKLGGLNPDSNSALVSCSQYLIKSASNDKAGNADVAVSNPDQDKGEWKINNYLGYNPDAIEYLGGGTFRLKENISNITENGVPVLVIDEEGYCSFKVQIKRYLSGLNYSGNIDIMGNNMNFNTI